MSSLVELQGGTVNSIVFNPQNRIIMKQFHSGNGITTDTQTRIRAEQRSLHLVPIAPEAKGGNSHIIFMSFVDGEKELDQAVHHMPEGRQAGVFFEAGKTLAGIHALEKQESKEYTRRHMYRLKQLLLQTAPVLSQHGISPPDLTQFLKESYSLREIDRMGVCWIHGDYWLNNVIGDKKNGSFEVHGVIDWELAKHGSPYEDFGLVELSIEATHPHASVDFWKGYGEVPHPLLKRHFAVVKVMDWVSQDDAVRNNNFSSDFYQQKFSMIRRTLYE